MVFKSLICILLSLCPYRIHLHVLALSLDNMLCVPDVCPTVYICPGRIFLSDMDAVP